MIDIFRCYNVTQKHASVFLDQKLEKYGLCSCHRIFIKRIASNPGITRDQMKNIAHVHPSNTTRAIDYLEEKGVVLYEDTNVDDIVSNGIGYDVIYNKNEKLTCKKTSIYLYSILDNKIEEL